MEKERKHIDIDVITRCIAGEASVAEQQELEAWLADDEANRREYDQLRKTWDALDRTQPGHRIDVNTEWERHQQMIGHGKTPVRKLFSTPFVRIAAVLIVLIGVGVLLYQYLGEEPAGPGPSPAGIRTVQLADGSDVTLNIESNIEVSKEFGKTDRRVTLKGEAYFEVERDTTRPFIIQVGNAEVMVLGTSFNIRAYEEMETIIVTVDTGKVSLYDKKEILNRVTASAGERAEYSRHDGSVSKSLNDDLNYLAWKTRMMTFSGDSLSYVVDVINRVYHKKVVLRDPEVENCPVTNSFNNKPFETVMEILGRTLDLTQTEEKNVIYLSGSGCAP